jgi:hypothetical protein
MIVASTGSPQTAYIMCSVLLLVSALMSLMTKAPEESTQRPSIWGQFKEQLAFARAQPVDVYMGARYI